ncbi:MAG: serine protease [Bacteroidota bacterium]|jgi:S1-C subfamily serine protease|nr:serine protease [Bacteroidota bacterium]
MITSNVLERIFHIKFGNSSGTCFAIDWEGRQYLVTAKHVISGIFDNGIIEIFFKAKWHPQQIKLIGHHPKVDVSVIEIGSVLSNLPLEPTAGGIALGQDVYFLGFPFSLSDQRNSYINRDFPLPLVKKGILSAMFNDEKGDYLLLDGINNPGFSGGPVVFKPNKGNGFKVAGIISGYRISPEPVYLNNDIAEYNIRANTGIIIAFNIRNATDIIEGKINCK